MISVKSKADLERLALARGGHASMAGGQFNSSRDRAQVARPVPAPAATPELPAQAAPVVSALDLTPLAQAQENMGRMLAEAIASLRTVAPVSPGESPAPQIIQHHATGWQFSTTRDKNGRLESIEAQPTETGTDAPGAWRFLINRAEDGRIHSMQGRQESGGEPLIVRFKVNRDRQGELTHIDAYHPDLQEQ